MENHLETILLVSVLSALVIGFGTAVAPSFAYLFVAMAVAMSIGAYFFADKLVLRLYGAQPTNASSSAAFDDARPFRLSGLTFAAPTPLPRGN